MLETPPTLRFPRPDELPNNPEVFERFEKSKRANIVEGFTLKYNTEQYLPFAFYSEININNSRLWKLFEALIQLLPNETSLVINLYEEKATMCPYRQKSEILDILRPFTTVLTQDCRLEFGLLYHTDNKLEEVFVSDTKYLKVWGNQEIEFRQLMEAFDLKETPDLNFVDEFPKVVESLNMYIPNVPDSSLIVKHLINELHT